MSVKNPGVSGQGRKKVLGALEKGTPEARQDHSRYLTQVMRTETAKSTTRSTGNKTGMASQQSKLYVKMEAFLTGKGQF